MIVAGFLLTAALVLTLAATEPGRADRRQQRDADEDAEHYYYWQQVRA